MRILVLGGTKFLGRHVVEAALEGGHELTLFHRGETNRGLFGDQVESVHGDRGKDLSPLDGRNWDVVIDTCGYVPRIVGASADLLADRVERYIFISTLSVYADNSTPGQDESGLLATLEDESVEEITGETYGGLKVLCENAVEAAFPGRALVIRPGLIVGPHDPTDRFTYWPVRASSGGPVLAPPANAGIEFTDGRDLARWVVHCAEERTAGVFNASGPGSRKMLMGDLLELCREVVGLEESPFVSVDEDFLLAAEVQPWVDLPMWIASDSPGFTSRSTDRAVAAGLEFRPASETVRDTLDWARSPGGGLVLKAGIDRERERAILDRWSERSESPGGDPGADGA